MLPAEQLELITAAVDGELSATEARAFRRLVDASPEARELYTKLKADSERVRALSRATPPADLRTKILARIAASTPKPVVVPAKPRPQTAPEPEPAPAYRSVPAWVPVALAASVLLCVTAGSFAFFNSSKPQNSIAKNPWSDALPAVQDTQQAVPSPTATAPQPGRSDVDAIVRINVLPVPPLPPPRPVVPEVIAVAPTPREVRHDFIGGPWLPPLPPFDLVQVRIPFLRTIAEFDRDDTRQELTDEFGRNGAPYRLDLFVRDTARGVEVFQNAAKAAGLTVFADATTLSRLKNKQVASVVIYTESLTAPELSALFAKLHDEDMKFSPRVCDSLHVMPVVPADEADLRAILGVDVGLFKRLVGSGGAGQGGEKGEKPVSAATIDSVSKTLTSPSAKVGDQTAVLMTWHPTMARTPAAKSDELTRYLDLKKRTPRKPNAVPAVIVIRPLG